MVVLIRSNSPRDAAKCSGASCYLSLATCAVMKLRCIYHYGEHFILGGLAAWAHALSHNNIRNFNLEHVKKIELYIYIYIYIYLVIFQTTVGKHLFLYIGRVWKGWSLWGFLVKLLSLLLLLLIDLICWFKVVTTIVVTDNYLQWKLELI